MDTLKIAIGAILVAILLVMFRRETYSESFGFSGYKKPVNYIKLDDPRPDYSGYSLVESNVDHDMMEKFAMETNKELLKRLGFSVYIIETQSVKTYEGGPDRMYECVFMVVKNDGFSFGFTVVASFIEKDGKIRIRSLRSQPLRDQAPDDISIYTKDSIGKEFVNYKLIKESAMPNIDGLESTKNKLS
jgi:hypothetical protein|tara:strand:- start:4 stop:567 length:564 start_codon:yes stop_codon:yes gene_type:complete